MNIPECLIHFGIQNFASYPFSFPLCLPFFSHLLLWCTWLFSSVQFSRSVVSDSLQPHELCRPPCPSPAPGVHSDSRPLSPWCHPAISSSVVPFSSCPQSLPASESLPMSQLFTWVGQSAGVSALAPFLSKNTQDWSPLEWTSWISLQSKGLSRVFSNTFPLLLQKLLTRGRESASIWASLSF